MPKIETIRLNFTGKDDEFYELWFNTKDKFYLKTPLPLEIYDVLERVPMNGFEELVALKQALKHIEADYHRLKATSRKVIIFNLTIGSDSARENNIGGFANVIGKNIHGYGFAFEFDIAMEYDDLGKKSYKLLTDKLGYEIAYHKNPYDKVMPYTDERFEALNQLKMLTSGLVIKLTGFFGNDIESITKALDSPNFLLALKS